VLRKLSSCDLPLGGSVLVADKQIVLAAASIAADKSEEFSITGNSRGAVDLINNFCAGSPDAGIL